MRIPCLAKLPIAIFPIFYFSRPIAAYLSSSIALPSISGHSSGNINRVSPTNLCKMSTAVVPEVSYINAETARLVDELLMAPEHPSFSLDQLMELAGLSVASAAHAFYTEDLSLSVDQLMQKKRKAVLVLCGPGNNGGDGLVAARHLSLFGYSPTVLYPKQNKLFDKLIFENQQLNINVLSSVPTDRVDALEAESAAIDSIVNYFNSFDLIIDSLFGFSFRPPIRKPFDAYIAALARASAPVLSVDVPSGWDVDNGDQLQTNFLPSAVISLSFPKLCMTQYKGIHFLGGRFIAPSFAAKLGLFAPDYGFNPSQVLRLSTNRACNATNATEVSEAEGNSLAVLFATASSIEEGKNIARVLVSKKLVACVNLVPQITSVYEWDGVLEESSEVLLIIKSRKSLIASITAEVKALHSYTVPETIAMSIIGGSSDYLQWLKDSTKDSKL